MEAVEQGLPEPPRPAPREVEAPEAEGDMEPADEWTGAEVWEHDGRWWTDFPAPAGFDGEEATGRLGFGYERTLTEAEQAVIDAELSEGSDERIARRDRYFGFAGDSVFCPWGCEPSEPYEPSAPDRDGSAGGTPPAAADP